MYKIFDSRDLFFKEPFGTVEQNTKIHFKIILPRCIQCNSATLNVIKDNSDISYDVGMFWCGMKGDSHEMWECHFTPELYGVFWYDFVLSTIEGQKVISKKVYSSQGIMESGESWQLTVSKEGFKTPSWFHSGIIYQIFPDRFFPSNTKKQSIPNDRIIQKDWFKDPIWQPNEKGEVTNNDYFCGDIEGIIQKLDYLKSLGVTCIYLNPIFESHSNHRYNTANYEKIDPLLGDIKIFRKLCKKAQKRGIRIILDGVFSHTGSDSIYFNKNLRYKENGAFNSKKSPYFEWYKFLDWPNEYKSWWGFKTLPETNELNDSFNNYINGEKGIIKKWIKLGASGWRLDVADELPDQFIKNIRIAAKSQDEDAVILGEVWEDASNKISYNEHKQFLFGEELDSVMNYPFKNAIIDFIKIKKAENSIALILSILENYPKQIINAMMNPLSTHDSERILTVLAGSPSNGRDRDWQSQQHLSNDEFKFGIKLLKIASLIQYTLPGIPSIYYGDEAGVEGYADPFNRRCFPWGKENKDLQDWYKKLGEIRNSYATILQGEFKDYKSYGSLMSYLRYDESLFLLCIFNCDESSKIINLPQGIKIKKVLIPCQVNEDSLLIESYSCALILLN